jgi:hypothetical protein
MWLLIILAVSGVTVVPGFDSVDRCNRAQERLLKQELVKDALCVEVSAGKK